MTTAMEKIRHLSQKQSEQKKRNNRRKIDELSLEINGPPSNFVATINNGKSQNNVVVDRPMSIIFTELMQKKHPSIVYSGIISIGRYCTTDTMIQDYLENKQILCQLHSWQINGLEFLENRENDTAKIGTKSLMLCDEMGLGKTIMSLQRILLENQECCRKTNTRFNGATLIVCKDILLVENWLYEVRTKWPAGTFHYYRLYSSGNEKLDRIYIENCCDFVIVTYSTVKFAYKYMTTEIEDNEEYSSNPNEDEQYYKYDILYNTKWKRVVADEAHLFSNESTLLFKAMSRLDSEIKWYVSASPIQNKWYTIYSIYNFIGIPSPQQLDPITITTLSPSKEQMKQIEAIKNIVMLRRRQAQVLYTNDLKLPLLFTKVTKRVRIIEFESMAEKLIYYQYAIYGMKKWESILEKKLMNQKNESTNIAHIIQLMIQICINIKILPELVLPHGLLTVGRASSFPLAQNEFKDALFEKTDLTYDSNSLTCFASRLNKPTIFTYNSRSNIIGKPGNYILEYRKSLRDEIIPLTDTSDINSEELEWNPYKKNSLFDLSKQSDRDLYENVYNQLSTSSSSSTKKTNNKKEEAMINHINSRSLPEKFYSTKNLHAIDYIQETPFNDKVIVFSVSIKALRQLSKDLDDYGISSLLISGDTTKNNSSSLRDFSENPKIKVLLLSLKLGCMGLNLICANHIIFLHQWWNPTFIDQGEERCNRMGQTKPVSIIHIILNKTIELFMANICINKRKITSNIIDDIHHNDDDDEEKNVTISNKKRRKLEDGGGRDGDDMNDVDDKNVDITAFSYNFAEYTVKQFT
jgi:SNF2 family DNA or RNA helicase